MKKSLILRASLFITLLATTLISTHVSAAERVALVIGNSLYSAVPTLDNPANDARAIARKLRQLNFLVIDVYDVDYSSFLNALDLFGIAAKEAKWAMVYYAGHGIQVNNHNYLLPVDASLARLGDLRKTIELDDLLSEVEQAGTLGLVVLDACRDNPFSARLNRNAGRSVATRGLARIESGGADTLIAFATSADEVALDGHQNGHSPYAAALIKHLATPGIDLRRMFGRVRDSVLATTGKQQKPYTYGSLGGAIYALNPRQDERKPEGFRQPQERQERVDGPIEPREELVVTGDLDTMLAQLDKNEQRIVRQQQEQRQSRQERHDRIVAHLQSALPKYNKIVALEHASERNKKPAWNTLLRGLPAGWAQGATVKVGDIGGLMTTLFPPVTEPASGMQLVYIMPDCFDMGSPANEKQRDSDEKQHEVCLTKGYYLGQHEVTQKEWRTVMGSDPPQLYLKGCDQCPVESVNWEDAQAFIKKVNRGQSGPYRLPSEAEWEYGARAGTATPFSTGECISTAQANYDGNYPYEGCFSREFTMKNEAVGSYAANAWGLHDMHGNVSEWVNDWYEKDYYASSPKKDPKGQGAGRYRVYRGGSWNDYARNLRSANRNHDSSVYHYNDLGFRLLRQP